jgi:hypothetical protein
MIPFVMDRLCDLRDAFHAVINTFRRSKETREDENVRQAILWRLAVASCLELLVETPL